MTARVCAVEGCERSHLALGWCGMHYLRHVEGRPMDAPVPDRMVDRPCSVEGCSGKHNARGLCHNHYKKWQRWGDPLGSPPVPPVVVCSVEGCDVPQETRGWCPAHYMRWYNNGDPTGSKPRVPQPVVGYIAVHGRLYRDQGKASAHLCVECGGQAQEWAYDHTDPDELTDVWGGRTVAYSLDPSHYLTLCKRCHRRFDYWHGRDRMTTSTTTARKGIS